jgi:hypothetical protein
MGFIRQQWLVQAGAVTNRDAVRINRPWSVQQYAAAAAAAVTPVTAIASENSSLQWHLNLLTCAASWLLLHPADRSAV